MPALLMSGWAGAAISQRAASIDIVPHCGPEGQAPSFTIGGVTIDRLEDPDIVERIKAATPPGHPEARIRADRETPYRCVGAIIFVLQRADYRRVGFISEPDGASERRP